ncbi:MAG: nitrile hydratase subunit beta [Chloroflexi bacterium]|nr:nitrile hydratase subunit beta [Chloroflexota bacterium]MCI0873685.1 nitrile hydratase subunit beta [Chloroflexota bacterium]
MREAAAAMPAFSAGDRVRVRDETPRHHHRTPQYVKARRGRVVEFIGAYLNSETRAHGGDGLPRVPMYRVEFDMTELWSEYTASATDKVWIDLYEHWIEHDRGTGD